jgi:leucyl aminopeptidase (aminopeptidase T)
MLDPRIWDGVDSLLDDYVRLGPDDFVVLLYTSDSQDAAIWVSVALELRGIAFERVWMAALIDPDLPARLAAVLPPPGELRARFVVFSFERDTMSHTRVIERATAPYDPARRAIFRTISAGASFFTDAVSVAPAELAARNTALLERLLGARKLRIRTDGGTDIEVTLDNAKHRWISNRGTAKQGGVVILPAGEVATYPASVTGLFVADFAFNVNTITDRDARLGSSPVRVWVEQGRVDRYACDDDGIQAFLADCFRAPCAVNVGELGFGTNRGVTQAIAMNSHINERRPGVHLGFGQHNQDPGVVGYQCAIHLDLIARGGLVWIDADPVPIDLENVTPSFRPHPSDPRDEDVFAPDGDEFGADCCGLIGEDGLQLCTPGAL